MKGSATASQVPDFYQQLALLVRANLPIPESLRQLGRDFPRPDFQAVLAEIGRRTERGETLSDAMRQYPRYFAPFQVQLIAAGEATGTLPEVLFTVARSARFAQMFAARIRDVLAYPMLTIHLAALVMFGISLFVIPVFSEMFDELLEGCALPALTQMVMDVAAFVGAHRVLVLTLYAALLVFSIWAFTPGVAAHRALLVLSDMLPGSCRLVRSLDAARLCSMWSAFLKRRMPLPDALAASAQLVERPALAAALDRMAGHAQSGTAVTELMRREPEIDRLIALTFEHTPEQDLAEELGRLAGLFEHRVALAARSATINWSILSLVVMAFLVGSVVIAMFMPLITIAGCLGA